MRTPQFQESHRYWQFIENILNCEAEGLLRGIGAGNAAGSAPVAVYQIEQ